MYPAPEIVTIDSIPLIGCKEEMSFSENKTTELWKRFMPLRRKKRNLKNELLYSVEQYPPGFFFPFNPGNSFTKWAAMERGDGDYDTAEFEELNIPAGEYAVFHYRGLPAEGATVYNYILTQWLPQSEYLPDERPHFALMGEKYNNDSVDSEEDIYIPVKRKITTA